MATNPPCWGRSKARDRADFGDPVIRRAVPLEEWRDRGFDPGDAVVATREGEVLGVVQEERRRGLGRALLLAAFEAFAAAGLTRGRLMVASDNPRARALYEGVGMRPAHELVALERSR